DDILLTIEHDDLREKLRNVNLLISKIEALNANPNPSSDCKTKSSSTSLNSLLEETNTFDDSLPEFETFCFDVEEISSGSTTTHPDISLSEYEAFHDDHVKEISSGSPTTHSDSPLYASFIFYLSINPFPPADRSDSYDFDVKEISIGSTTTHPDLSLLEYEAFHDNHIKEFSSGSPTTHSAISLSEYDSFMFDLSTNPFPPADRSDSYELNDELIPFISAPEYDCFRFKLEL
nr:hypothetical protein [Tanacetum cinerariifolium]